MFISPASCAGSQIHVLGVMHEAISDISPCGVSEKVGQRQQPLTNRPSAAADGRGGGPGGTNEYGVIHMNQESAVIIANDRDKRALAWLKAQVGLEAIQGATERLAGARRPYVSNVAKVLGLTLPVEDLVEPEPPRADRETALKHLAELRAVMDRAGRPSPPR